MLKLHDFLFDCGLPRDDETKLVRHQDPRWDVQRLLSLGHLDFYQEHQSKPVFDDCDYIVSFVGQSYSHAKLLAVYRVLDRQEPTSFEMPLGFPYPNMPLGPYRYRLERATGFEDLERRLVIDWGGSTRSWHQWLSTTKPKKVVEILPEGYVTEFRDYDDFVLTFDELQRIINQPMACRDWHRRLAAVAGVYLITDQSDGGHYVGSAYGAEGILGRWREYAKSGHGGNVVLKKRVGADPNHARHFTFTLLKTLPKTLTRDEVIEQEAMYKAKLGSLVRGLNLN